LHSVKDPTSRLARWRLKLAEYEYEVVYKAGKINVNADVLSRNPLIVLPLRGEVSGKVDPKELPLLRRFPRNKNPGSDTATNNRLKKTQFDINTQPIKINSNTENKHNDAEVRDVGPSLTKDLQEIDNQNNSDSESENESISEESYIDTIEQTGDSSTNNIIKIRDSLFARTDSIVIFLTQDGEPYDDGSHLLTKDNRVPTIKNATLEKESLES